MTRNMSVPLKSPDSFTVTILKGDLAVEQSKTLILHNKLIIA